MRDLFPFLARDMLCIAAFRVQYHCNKIDPVSCSSFKGAELCFDKATSK